MDLLFRHGGRRDESFRATLFLPCELAEYWEGPGFEHQRDQEEWCRIAREDDEVAVVKRRLLKA